VNVSWILVIVVFSIWLVGCFFVDDFLSIFPCRNLTWMDDSDVMMAF